MTPRRAELADAEAIAVIYNQGIAERVATFETRPRRAREIVEWLGGSHPVIVVEAERRILGFAASSAYRPARECYAGVAEFAVYVDPAARRRGVGRAAITTLLESAAQAGFWKLVSRVFVENDASRALLCGVGFREVGIYRRHARLDGEWRDVVIVERLLGEATA